MNPVISACDLITPLGQGLDACWNALLAGRSAIRPLDRFDTRSFISHVAACVDGIQPLPRRSIILQLLERILPSIPDSILRQAVFILATTAGEIDLLESAMLASPRRQPVANSIQATLSRLYTLLPGSDGCLLSAACASSTVALSLAADMIRENKAPHVLVLAADAVTEFVYAGFSTLMALSPDPARPFDSARRGLSLGEAAAWAIVSHPDHARAAGLKPLAVISGHGIANDANHMTSPSREASGLIASIRRALHTASLQPRDIHSISAHGTGTPYNDAMEMKAFRTVFGDTPIPTASIKGAIGHTLGAAGLVECLVAARSLTAQITPPTAGLLDPEPDFRDWVSANPVPTPGMTHVLATNSGFGGINAALILSAPEPSPPASLSKADSSPQPPPPPPLSLMAGPAILATGWLTPTEYGYAAPDATAAFPTPPELSTIWKDSRIVPAPPRNHARFDPASRATCAAVGLALRAAGLEPGPGRKAEIGIFSSSLNGCQAANVAYFADYLSGGRVLSRGNLFLYTLPTSPLAEAAICHSLRGPSGFFSRVTIPFTASWAAALAVQNGAADFMLLVIQEPDAALALLIGPAAPGNIPFSTIADFIILSDNSPRLADTIQALRAPGWRKPAKEDRQS